MNTIGRRDPGTDDLRLHHGGTSHQGASGSSPMPRACFPISRMCRVLGVSQSGVFASQHRPACRRHQQDMVKGRSRSDWLSGVPLVCVLACSFRDPRIAPAALHSIACFCVQFSRSSLRSGRIALYVPHIRPAFALSNGTCGGPRMNRDLFDKGPEIGRHRTARVMRQNQPITRPGRFRRPGGGMGFPLSIHSFFPGVMKPRAWPQPWAQSRAPAPGGPEQRSVRARTSAGHPAASPRPSSRDPIPAARLAVALLRWARSR